jgi:autotransporter passenger strand-loop-strand repeat protein
MTIDLVSNGTVVALSGSVASGLTLQGNEQLYVYQGSEVDSTAVYTGGELDVFNGATAQNTTLFGGTEDISATGLAVDTTADGGLQYVSGEAVGATITSGAEQYVDGNFEGTAASTVLMDGGFQELWGIASNTTIFSGSLEFVQGYGISESTIIENGGAEIVQSGTAADSTIESGGLLVVLPGASVTGTTLLAGGSSVSSGVVIVGGTVPFYAASLATSLTASGETSYILHGGTAAAITISGGSEVVYAGGTIVGNVLENHSGAYIETGGTAMGGQIGDATEVIEAGGISVGDTVLSQGMLIVYGTATNVVVQAGGTLTGGSVNNVTLDGGYASIGSLTGTALLGSNATLSGGPPTAASVSFAGTNAELLLPEYSVTASNLGGLEIGGFFATDTIILEGFSATSESFVSGVGLELSNGTVTETLDIVGSFSTGSFAVSNTSQGTEISLCYLRGTRIATPAGEAAVETLKIGDAAITRFGGYRRIKWIGRQSFGARFIRDNRHQLPVRIGAGALGGGLPRRDLLVSPGH